MFNIKGRRIKHNKYGIGTIRNYTIKKGKIIIGIDFNDNTLFKLFIITKLTYTKLKFNLKIQNNELKQY